MLACDTCNEWFHFHCVGVSPPTDPNAAISEFHCPTCVVRGGKEVLGLSSLPVATRLAVEGLQGQQPKTQQLTQASDCADEEMPQAPDVDANAISAPEPVSVTEPSVNGVSQQGSCRTAETHAPALQPKMETVVNPENKEVCRL